MSALELAKQLIGFDSVSSRSNVAVTDFVEERLRKTGFEVERLEYTDAEGVRKASVIGKKGRGKGGLAYFGHTDVVPADDWSIREQGPFEGTEKNGRLYGRGSCDMKGSVASMLAAAGEIAGERLRAPVYVCCTADEEVGYHGAAQVAGESRLYRELVEAQTPTIIGEPTRLEVVHAHKGTYGFVATSVGRAAHSSTREGVNANLAMIPFLGEMKRIHDETLTDPAWQHKEFDPPGISWNIGINDFTRAVNITAPKSVCTVYFRPAPGQEPERLIERARRAAAEQGLKFEVKTKGNPVYADPESAFVKEMLRLTGREKARTVCYGTDGAMFGELKNMVVYGPGDIAQAHTSDEWIDMRQLEEGAQMYAKLIERYCCGG